MNRRWITLSGRTGTVLMAAGLALVLLSMIPPRKVDQSDFFGAAILGPKTFIIDQAYLLEPLTPQNGFYVSIRANGSTTLCLLKLDKEYVYHWILTRFPEVQLSSALNASLLEDLLNAHPDSAARREDFVGETVVQYVPSGLMNVTMVLWNQGMQTASISYRGRLLNFIVPSERALNPAKFAMPIGVVLTIPWLISAKKRVVTKPLSNVVQVSGATPQESRKAKPQSTGIIRTERNPAAT